MTARRTTDHDAIYTQSTELASPAEADPQGPSTRFRRETDGPRSLEEAESQYVAARTVWVDAMRTASSGRPADLAALAIAQDAYERAAMERTRWENSPRTSIAVEPPPKKGIDIAVGQELAWRQVRDAERRGGFLGRVFRRRSRS